MSHKHHPTGAVRRLAPWSATKHTVHTARAPGGHRASSSTMEQQDTHRPPTDTVLGHGSTNTTRRASCVGSPPWSDRIQCGRLHGNRVSYTTMECHEAHTHRPPEGNRCVPACAQATRAGGVKCYGTHSPKHGHRASSTTPIAPVTHTRHPYDRRGSSTPVECRDADKAPDGLQASFATGHVLTTRHDTEPPSAWGTSTWVLQ